MDLIDRNKLKLHHVWAERHTASGNVCKLVVEVADIEKLPTVDAEPVIRCKDCKYWDYEVDNDVGFCVRTEDCDWNADDFCSRGKREKPTEF